MGENWKSSAKSYFKTWIGISFFGIFMVYFLSIVNTSNLHEFGNILKNRLPFLFIPISLIYVNNVEKKQLKLIQYIFIFCCLISSFWSYFQYIQNVELYTKLYAQGEVIPTLIHHVSFAVLLCIAVLFLLNNLISASSKIAKIINLILLIWFIYFIHVLSVRTGIVLLYIGTMLFGFYSLFTNKKPMFVLSLLLLLVFGSYVFYQKIPTLKNKIAYTFYGISQYKNRQDSTNQVSDSRRILSDKIGIEIIQKDKLFGVGIGDLKDEMNLFYKQHYPQFKPDVYSHIHNQYLYTICGVGLILGILFCVFLVLPFIQFIIEKNVVFSIIYLLLLLVMSWESFIESQLGTSIFLVICSLGFLSKKEV